MRTIEIVIKVDVDDAELMRLLNLGQVVIPEEKQLTKEAEVTEFKCPHCEYSGKNQNAVNSHLKYCKNKPEAKKETAAPTSGHQRNPEAKPGRSSSPQKRKIEVKPKPKVKPYIPLPDADLKQMVVSAVLAGNGEMVLSEAIANAHIKRVRKELGNNPAADKDLKSFEAKVTKILRRIAAIIGPDYCVHMEMAGEDSFGVAILGTGSLTAESLLKEL